MKTLSLGFIGGVVAAAMLLAAPAAFGQSWGDGAPYPEITDLGKARTTRAQPQLGSMPTPRLLPTSGGPVAGDNVSYSSSADVPYTAQLPARSSTMAPADSRPVITPVTSAAVTQTTAQTAVATPYAYGYGYTSVGSPQKVVQVVQPVGYANSLPQQQVIYVQPVAVAQPVANQQVSFVQPTTAMQPVTTLQGGTTAFNPYVQTKGVPWRPIVPIRNMPDNYVVGQGIIGQPKVYVPSQPVRNFIRYVTP